MEESRTDIDTPVTTGLAVAQWGSDHIADVIARRAFGPVFQPIVDLRRDEIVGYEALTRFTDGSDPELASMIAEFRDDEREHLSAALDAGAERAPAYPLLSGAIRLGCRMAIRLSERI